MSNRKLAYHQDIDVYGSAQPLTLESGEASAFGLSVGLTDYRKFERDGVVILRRLFQAGSKFNVDEFSPPGNTEIIHRSFDRLSAARKFFRSRFPYKV